MAKVLFINPNKWGRGITPIWVASHTGLLKKNDHEVDLFDCTFFLNWTDNEIKFNTENRQYKKSNYENLVKFDEDDVFKKLQKKIDNFCPDVIFWSAISSHIHGEGEYVNIEHGYNLISKMQTKAILITGGLQATASPKHILENYNKINYLIRGESEVVLLKVLNRIKENAPHLIESLEGLSYLDKNKKVIENRKQKIISDLDDLEIYDYSIFDDQVFYRPYNGEVLRGIDYEMSRGCVFTCGYCVETIIQRYYGFEENTRGLLKDSKNYLRNKSAERILDEILKVKKEKKIDLLRCQDTNFLTINRKTLLRLAELFQINKIDIKLYIETRPEGITDITVELLKKLNVDGVGMGIELAAEGFREESLNRYASHQKIINAFEILKKNNIKRTAYNIIGLPNQTEEMIKNTIEYNKMLNPDNVTVAYYSPYTGTNEQIKSVEVGDFENNVENVDGQLRSLSKSSELSIEKLDYYKKNFVNLVYNL
jgi:anaerobic magnesium-protoporphyrin IX monomethyl ester cyclase